MSAAHPAPYAPARGHRLDGTARAELARRARCNADPEVVR
jgi:hypothetical protein